MSTVNIHNHEDDNGESGIHPIYGGTSWGILHNVEDHHKIYSVNYGVLSKAELDPATGNIYIDKSIVPLDPSEVRWVVVTDHHKLAKLLWAHRTEITQALHQAGYTSQDSIELSAVIDKDHHTVDLDSANDGYAFDTITITFTRLR
jgi:hypothetical protein